MKVRLIDLIGVLSRALDLVSSTLGMHHAHVGCLSARIAGRMGLSAAMQRDILIAGMLHDAGAVALHTSLESLVFERDLYTHARAGELLFSKAAGLDFVSEIIGEHHTPWSMVPNRCGNNLALAANIVNFADFIDIRLKRNKPYHGQFNGVLHAVHEAGKLLNPACIDIFSDMVANPQSLDGLFNPHGSLYTEAQEKLEQVYLNAYEVVGLCGPFAQVIDFRSRFTATHSRGVAMVAQDLACIFGFDVEARNTMYVAGLLHDVGKLAVPNKLLEKCGQLEAEEFLTVKNHARVSEYILGGVEGLEQVCEWASQHHERLDGSGYPHGKASGQLSFGARILQVADVFTAITEDRPYRIGMDIDQAKDVMRSQVQIGALDAEVVQAMFVNLERINATREREQQRAKDEFEEFSVAVRGLTA